MTVETIKTLLLDNAAIIGVVATLLGIGAAIWLFFSNVFKTVLSWFRPQSKPGDSAAIVDRLVAITEKRF